MSRQNRTQQRTLHWVLFVLVTGLPLILRSLNGAPVTPLDSSYAHIGASNNLYDLLLQLFPSPLLPFILGVVAFFLLTQIFRKGYTLMLFTITPLVITTFTTHNVAALFFPLALGMFFLSRVNPYLALLAIPSLVFTDVLAGTLVTLVAITAYLLRERRRTPAVAAFAVLFASVFVSLQTGFGATNIQFHNYIGEFGGVFGYSLFILLLGLVFIVQHWRTINASHLLLWLIAFFLSGQLLAIRPLVLLPLIWYAAEALRDLNMTEWKLTFMKHASFFLLVCLGVFVVITHMKLLAEATPQADLLLALEKTDDQLRPGSILTTTNYEQSLKHFTNRRVIAMPNDHAVWKTFSLQDAKPFLTANDIRFILVTPEMTNGDVWSRDEGFRFLMLNNNYFFLIYQQNGYEVWGVAQEYIT